uniref:Reverse transcriptase domain-containing protein n=1 Tax=Fagus sylvatica TaxID=28930 RepID=A0A2N9GE52_FAGSY
MPYHVRRSFSIIDYVHPAPMCSVNGGAGEQMISFSDSDLKDVQLPHNDPLVITLRIGNYDVQRVLVDQGSFAENEGNSLHPSSEAEIPYERWNHAKRRLDKEQLLQLLMSNRDVFAWSVYNAPGVSPDLSCHALNIGLEHKPVAQKQRKLAPERATIILEELERLLASGAIREVQYPGYHQIPIITDQERQLSSQRGTYCYKVMPFGLKNAGATYQRMVTKLFGHMIGKTVEVYIDDMLIKSLQRKTMQPTYCKCHIVSRRGIKANPDQIAALVDLAEPRNIKQVQRLTGMVAALRLFISRSADKCKPFFRLLGKRSKFVWNKECSVAFQGIKAYLSTPMPINPNLGEPLFLYLAVSDHAVSAVLVRELGQDQKPVFFSVR